MNPPFPFTLSAPVRGPLTVLLSLGALGLAATGSPSPLSWPASVVCLLGALLACGHLVLLLWHGLTPSSPPVPTPLEMPVAAAPSLAVPSPPAPASVAAPLPTPAPALLDRPLPAAWQVQPEGEHYRVIRADRRAFLVTFTPQQLPLTDHGTTLVVWHRGELVPARLIGRAWHIGGHGGHLLQLLEAL